LVAIDFFAHGSHQRPARNQCELVVRQPKASCCMCKVAQLINIHLIYQWIKFPLMPHEKTIAQNKFAIPGAVRVIDCTYSCTTCS